MRNSKIFKSGLGFHVISQDAEQMREQSAFWSYEHKQYNSGTFTGEITAFHTNRLQVSNIHRSNGVFLRGGLPPKTTIFCYHFTDPRKVIYRGSALSHSQVMALNHNEELEYHSLYPSTVLTIAVDTELLNERSISICGDQFSSLRNQERITMKPGYYKNQACNLLSILQSCLEGSCLNSEKAEEEVENEILEIILSGVQHPEKVNKSLGRLDLAKKAEKYIRRNLKDPVTINALCQVVGTTERTLHLGFKERFGMSPGAYMQLMRLNGVFQELNTNNAQNRVSEVAIDWGFNHLGRFAKQYKRMFGRLPSETLQGRRSDFEKEFSTKSCLK